MKRDLIPALIAFIAVAAVCYGIAVARPATPPTPSEPAAARGGENERVIMRVNGEPVTEREFNSFLAQAPEQMQFYYATPEGRRILADELVKLKALEQEGRRLGVENEPEVASRLEMNRTNVVAGSALRKIIGEPSEARLRAEYDKQKAQFETTELSHILIAHEGGAVPPRSGQPPPEAQAMAKAQRLVSRLRSGADFVTLARQESDDVQSAANGGSLGPIEPASLPPQIQSAIAGLKPGQISDPVRSEFGIHIFRAGERTAQPFEAVRDALAARLQRDEAEAAMERLQKAANVELDPKFFPPPKQQQPPPRG